MRIDYGRVLLMKIKTIVTVVLLLFVAVSVGYLVVRETGGSPVQDPAQHMDKENKIIAFYFHGNVRCVTCRKIEAFAKEAIETGFADEIKDGRLEWRAVNVEDPVHEHYIEDFQLSTRSVVLERITGGENLELKRLDSVWKLVHGDKEIFLAYIQDETREFFEAADK